jgi:phosphinothricin acetyltransferase
MGSRSSPSDPGNDAARTAGVSIRHADPARDAAACAAIYAPFVSGSAVSFEEEPPGEDEMRERIGAARSWLVAERDGAVAGFAYATPYRARPAYRWAVETSVYVSAAGHGRGTGRALYEALLAELESRGFRAACAAIALPNPPSVALHEAVGFAPVGIFRDIGFKAGAWRDVGWWQRPLGSGRSAPGELR